MDYSGGSTLPREGRYFIGWDQVGYGIQKILVFIWLVSPCPLDQVLILSSWCLWEASEAFYNRCLSIQLCSPSMYTHTQHPSHQEQDASGALSLCWGAAKQRTHSDSQTSKGQAL